MCDNEPPASLSDFHDYEPNLEFDDTELSQAPPPQLLNFDVPFDDDSFQSGKTHRFFASSYHSSCESDVFARKRSSDEVVLEETLKSSAISLVFDVCECLFVWYCRSIRHRHDFFTPTDKIFFYQTKQYKKT